jgi:phosphoribosyl-AMP cyclohydrolase
MVAMGDAKTTCIFRGHSPARVSSHLTQDGAQTIWRATLLSQRIGCRQPMLVDCRLLSVIGSRALWEVIIVADSSEPLPFLTALKWNDEGLIPAIVQDAENGDVLMMAWMDEPALRDTMTTGQTHFFSRSRRSHWHKGATSGHVQHVESISIDCDGDVLLIKARQVGGACHEGYRSCFFRRVAGAGQLEIVASPVFDAASIYGSSHGMRR